MKDYKYDDGKVRMELLPLECLTEIAKVLTYGANKYKDNSWKTVKNGRERYKGALLRHLAAADTGEVLDPETGLSHAAHMACNALFLLWYELEAQNEKRGLDG